MKRYTPEAVGHLRPGEVFVFGSNRNGDHYGGAAHVAYERFGAQWGVGEGLTGRSYALPTLDESMSRVSPDDLEESFRKLIACAEAHPDLTFLLTKVGCGIAGWSVDEVGDALWRAAKGYFAAEAPQLRNIVLPREFASWFEP